MTKKVCKVAKIINIFVEYQDIINIKRLETNEQKKTLQNLQKVVAKIAEQHNIAINFLVTSNLLRLIALIQKRSTALVVGGQMFFMNP